MRALFLVAATLPACLPTLSDSSLESHAASVSGEEDFEVTGALAVTAGADEGDWTVTVGDAEVALHSPSHADLSALAGAEVTLSAQYTWGGGPNVVLSDDAGVVYLATGVPGFDGSEPFGEARWRFGEPIGKGVITNEYDEDWRVTYMDVVVADDAGDLVLLPGEPTTVRFDGVAYRFTVLAAYQPHIPRGLKCGPSDMLGVELIRVDDGDDTPLVRPSALRAAIGGC